MVDRTNYIEIGKKLQKEYEDNFRHIPDLLNREALYNAFAKKFLQKQQQEGIFNKTADQLCQMIVDMMNARIKAKAKNLQAQAEAERIDRNGNDIFFTIRDGDYAFNETWEKFDAKGDLIPESVQQKFDPKASGIMGTFFEALFLGKKAESSGLPDIENLLEAKTSVDKIGKGGMDVGDLTARFNQGYIKDAIDKTVDEGFVRAFGFLKIIEKIANLIVIRTEIDKEGSDKNTEARKWIKFTYLSAEIYAKLNIEKIWAAYLLSGTKGNEEATDGFYQVTKGKIDVKSEREYDYYPEGLKGSGDWWQVKPGGKIPRTDPRWFARVPLTVKIRGADLHDGKGIESTKLYLDMKNLFDFPGGKDAFRDAMHEIEVEQLLWDSSPDAYEWRRNNGLQP